MILTAHSYAGFLNKSKACSRVGAHQESGAVETVETIEQLLDYVATYPDDGILF